MKTIFSLPLLKLSQREIEVIKLVAAEYTTHEIANQLFLSTETVKSHKANIRSKLEVKNAPGIVRAAFEQGILSVNQALPEAS